MVLVLGPSISGGETARNHNLVTNPIFVLELDSPLVTINHHTVHTCIPVQIHSSDHVLLALSSPQPFHSLLHHIRNQSPQLVNSHLHHDKVLRRTLLLLLLRSRGDPSSHVAVAESRRTHRRRCRRRQTTQERIDGFGRGCADS